MFNVVLRFLGLVPYSRMELMATELLSEFELKRHSIRKESLEEMDKLNPTKDGEKIQKLLLQMNRDISILYEKENIINEFIAKIK